MSEELCGPPHRCGDCGDATFSIHDLEAFAAQFDEADWPSKGAAAFVELLKAVETVPTVYGDIQENA